MGFPTITDVLRTAPKGAVCWTENLPSYVTATAVRVGCTVSTEVFYAVHPGSRKAITLTRFEVVEPCQPTKE